MAGRGLETHGVNYSLLLCDGGTDTLHYSVNTIIAHSDFCEFRLSEINFGNNI